MRFLVGSGFISLLTRALKVPWALYMNYLFLGWEFMQAFFFLRRHFLCPNWLDCVLCGLTWCLNSCVCLTVFFFSDLRAYCGITSLSCRLWLSAGARDMMSSEPHTIRTYRIHASSYEIFYRFAGSRRHSSGRSVAIGSAAWCLLIQLCQSDNPALATGDSYYSEHAANEYLPLNPKVWKLVAGCIILLRR